MVGLGLFATPSEAQAPLKTHAMTIAAMEPKALAHLRVMEQWGSNKEFGCLDRLIHHESRWNPKALNKSSGAFGLFQFLPSTWRNYKFPHKPKEVSIQIKAGLRYITVRYGSPCNAWAFWQRKARAGNPWY